MSADSNAASACYHVNGGEVTPDGFTCDDCGSFIRNGAVVEGEATGDDAQGFGLEQAAALVAPPSMEHRPVHDPRMTNPSDPDYLAPAARWCIVCARPDREHICTTCVRRADDHYDNAAAGEHCADKVHEPFYATASSHALTFAPNADPAETAKVAARLAKALKPSCLDCGKNLTAKELRAGRVCTDHTACRLRRILHGPKCPALSYGLA